MASRSSSPPRVGAIGSDVWPGLGKASEECGELLQLLGRLIAYPEDEHPSGRDPAEGLVDEIGDLQAALEYLVAVNPIDALAVRERKGRKLALFMRWHLEERQRAKIACVTG